MKAIPTYNLDGLLKLLLGPNVPQLPSQLQSQAQTTDDLLAVAHIGAADRHLRTPGAPVRFSFNGVGLVLSGSSQRTIGLKEFTLEPSILFFVPAYQILNILSTSDDFEACMVVFSPEFYALRVPQGKVQDEFPFFQLQATPYLRLPSQDAPMVATLMEALEREFMQQAASWKAVCHAYLRAVLLIAQRHYQQRHEHEAPKSPTGFALAQRFQSLLEQHFVNKAKGEPVEPKSAGDYAQLLHVEESYLTEAVKAVTGRPPTEIIRERTLLEAKHLMRHTDLTLAEIADYLDFNDPAYFSRVFKKQTGISPTHYRRL